MFLPYLEKPAPCACSFIPSCSVSDVVGMICHFRGISSLHCTLFGDGKLKSGGLAMPPASREAIPAVLTGYSSVELWPYLRRRCGSQSQCHDFRPSWFVAELDRTGEPEHRIPAAFRYPSLLATDLSSDGCTGALFSGMLSILWQHQSPA